MSRDIFVLNLGGLILDQSRTQGHQMVVIQAAIAFLSVQTSDWGVFRIVSFLFALKIPHVLIYWCCIQKYKVFQLVQLKHVFVGNFALQISNHVSFKSPLGSVLDPGSLLLNQSFSNWGHTLWKPIINYILNPLFFLRQKPHFYRHVFGVKISLMIPLTERRKLFEALAALQSQLLQNIVRYTHQVFTKVISVYCDGVTTLSADVGL